MISVSDYFVEFLIKNGIQDVFGYQGGMVAYFFDSIGKHKNEINVHTFSNEQGAAFAACGYAQATGKPGILIVTSGPGFTNAITGIANAWFDSIPLICIAGQANTKDKRREMPVRQYGFQEIQSFDVSSSITKATYEVDDNTNVCKVFEDALKVCLSERMGPVVIDFPINICRNLIDHEKINNVEIPIETKALEIPKCFDDFFSASKPLILAGNGIKQAGLRTLFRKLVDKFEIPVVSSLPACDILPSDNPYYLGYIGGTARREAPIALEHCDYLLSIGSRMCHKQIGYDMKKFAPNAKLIRIDIDSKEFLIKAKENEVDINIDLKVLLPSLLNYGYSKNNHLSWNEKCFLLKEALHKDDINYGNEIVKKVTSLLPDDANIVLDVGNNMVYAAQSSIIKKSTTVFSSNGLGSMGYSIPASIGVNIGNSKITCSFNGDGGAQMNIQELNAISRTKRPIKIFVMNNKSLAHIVLFQDHYLEHRYVATRDVDDDYYSCDFKKIGEAYGIRSFRISSLEEFDKYREIINDNNPALFEIEFVDTSILPNIHAGEDYLHSNPSLKKETIKKIEELMEN